MRNSWDTHVWYSYYIGQMSATGMMVATEKWDNELSWRLPLYIQVCFIPFTHPLAEPESSRLELVCPRWDQCSLNLPLPRIVGHLLLPLHTAYIDG
jgi:hypothetical protein